LPCCSEALNAAHQTVRVPSRGALAYMKGKRIVLPLQAIVPLEFSFISWNLGRISGFHKGKRQPRGYTYISFWDVLFSTLVTPESPVTQLLRKSRQGDQEATNRLIPVVYNHLHALASRYMRRERPDHTLSATALLNEAYLKLAGSDIEWQDRSHFFVIASRIMRQVLVDHAKARNRMKRGAGGHKVALDEIDLPGPPAGNILELDEALTRFARQDERKARLIELLYFGGLTYQEAALALGVSEVTVHRDVKIAKAWLRKALTP
jgi:RNA polymerase sigma factor (TIGR02999 family)